jgi:hypothetical protein
MIKSGSSLVPGIRGFFADILFNSAADKIDQNLPSKLFENSKEYIADKAKMTKTVQGLPLAVTPAMKADYENSQTEDGVVKALETYKKLSDLSLKTVRDTFNSVSVAAEMQFGTDSFVGGGHFADLEKQYNEIEPLVMSGKATREQYQSFGNSLAENAAKNPQFVNLQTFFPAF